MTVVGDNQPFDLIIYCNGIFYKIQVKTTEKIIGGSHMKFGLNRTNPFTKERFLYNKDEVDSLEKIDYVLNKYIEDYMFRKQLQKDVMNIRVKTSDNFIKKAIEAILGFYDSYEAGYTRNIYFARWI